MARIIDPTSSTKPIQQWMTGAQPNSICCATNGPDDPENGGGVDGPPLEFEAEPAIVDTMDLSSFTAYSPNVPRGTPPLHLLSFSSDNKVVEYNLRFRSLFQLAKSTLDPLTGLRRAIVVATEHMPFELSSMLFSARRKDYVSQYVDDIVFCPFIAMMDSSLENVVHVPDIAIYVLEDIGSERKLLINLYKPIYTDSQGVTDFVSRPDYEIFPDIIDGALRLHMMEDVMAGKKPREHLEPSYIRERSIALQISALSSVMKIYKGRGLAYGRSYEYWKTLWQKLAVEWMTTRRQK